MLESLDLETTEATKMNDIMHLASDLWYECLGSFVLCAHYASELEPNLAKSCLQQFLHIHTLTPYQNLNRKEMAVPCHKTN